MKLRVLALAVLPLAPLLACGDDTDAAADATATAAAPGPTLEGSITVFAAASLTDAFEELGAAFEAVHPEVTVGFNFAGSSALREQILGGAPADVFASADSSNMAQVLDAGLATGPRDFVENLLQIAVPLGNPAGVTGLADFADGDLLLGLCAPEVPCGQFGAEALASAGVTPSVDTLEPDVRALLTKIEAGELDAGIVYRTDVLSGEGSVEGIDIPADQNVVATYPIVALAEAPNGEVAAAFVAFVLSDDGQELLGGYGFDTE